MWVDGSDATYRLKSAARTPARIRLREWRRQTPPGPRRRMNATIGWLRFDTTSQLALRAQPVIEVGAICAAAFEEQLVRTAGDLIGRDRRRGPGRFDLGGPGGMSSRRSRFSLGCRIHQRLPPSDPARMNEPSAPRRRKPAS